MKRFRRMDDVRMRPLRTRFISTVLGLSLAGGITASLPQAQAQWDQRGDFYHGVRDRGHDGGYYGQDHYYDRDYRPGGVGPGRGAAIGAAGGAALGAAFGGGLQGTIVGGAVGAGIGTVAGQAHQDRERRDYYYRGRRY